MKALIIEDETLIARELRELISRTAPDIEVVETLPSLKTARRWFMAHPEPDLIFMDIQLADGMSFELFGEFSFTCPVVFTTAYDEYALKAFQVNGVDYLLKPVDEEALSRALGKCRALIASRTPPQHDLRSIFQQFIQGEINPGPAYKEKFIVQSRRQWVPVNTAEIGCFCKDGLNYLLTFSGEKYVLDYETLDEVESLLNPKEFFRANRQFIIHIESILSVKPHENQKLTVTLKQPLNLQVDISREKAPIFRKWFDR